MSFPHDTPVFPGADDRVGMVLVTSDQFVAHVAVPVTGLWQDPSAPRRIDGPAIDDAARHTAWLEALDRAPSLDEGRLGLMGRYESEVLDGEPVVVHDTTGDGWSRVTCPWQPSHKDPAGYPGYVRTAHLRAADDGGSFETHPGSGAIPATVTAFLAEARRHLGLPYLWGGISPQGVDCSGLVHYCARTLGLMVPRDGDDQYTACEDVPVHDVQPGDLYFFAYPGKTIHHVGIIASKGHIIHAPSTGQVVKEEPLPDERVRTLVAAGRIRELG